MTHPTFQSRAELVRVQDRSGRGPYIPGFSHRWADTSGPASAPWWEELGITIPQAIVMIPADMHVGCAFQSMDLLTRWFTKREREKLHHLGFYVVKVSPDVVVAETPTQVVFGTKAPLFALRKAQSLRRVTAAHAHLED